MKAIVELKETWLIGDLQTGKDIEKQEKVRELELSINDEIDTMGFEKFVVKEINNDSVVIECENGTISEITEKGTISLLSTEKEFTLIMNEQKGIAITVTDYSHNNYFTLKEIIS